MTNVMRRTIVFILILATSEAFSPPLWRQPLLANNVGPSTTPRVSTALFRGSISAAPSFDEYMKQRAAEEEAEAASAEANSNSDAPIGWGAHAPLESDTNAVQSPPDATASASGPTSSSHGHSQKQTHSIGRLLLQRSIQTQLHYLADMRDEPTYVWLRGFLDHTHLDDKGRFNELDGLHAEGGWRGYLTQLGEAPPVSFTVQLAPPRLSEQQKRNPFLAAQAVGRSYEETIDPAQVYQTIGAVARSLEREWAADLNELAEKDRARVAVHFEGEGLPYLQTARDAARDFWMKHQVVAGGEGDDQGTPLHNLNRRLVARFCTRAALRRVLEDLRQGDGLEEEARRRSAAAGQYLLEFHNEWVPRLQRGADDEVRRGLGTAPPGQWQRLCSGADAEDVTEALWQELSQPFAEESEEAMRLYSSEALAARLRRARADVCDEVAEELRMIVANEFC